MFKSIGGFLGRVFGSDENIGKTADMIRDGLDKMVYTDEEKADYTEKSVVMYLEFLRLQTDGGHLARRLLMLMVASAWWCTVFLLVWFGLAGDTDRVNLLVDVMKEFIAVPFLAVMTFYFGHRILQSAFTKGEPK